MSIDNSDSATHSSAIFHRSLTKRYDTASGGDGVYIHHPDGSRTLDGSSGAAVSCLGHRHKAVIDAIIEQAGRMAFAHTSFFTSDPAEELARFLIDQSDNAFTKVMFLSSGSEAVESAIKLARQYHVARGEPLRQNFICRQHEYHGNTLGALSAGYNPPRRKAFEPLLSPAFHHVSRCFYARDAKARDEASYVKDLLQEYEQVIQNLGHSSIAGIIVEPIGGATLGAVPAARGYLAGLRILCDKYSALLIFDEVMCGMGRTGTLHAWQSLENVAPDLETIGKGLGAGYQPISAVLISSGIHQTLERTGAENPFISGHTYQGHAIGCAAALAVQKTIQKDNLLSNVKAMGDLLESQLSARMPYLEDIRGCGLFKAVEFSASYGEHIAADVVRTCLAHGAAVYLCSSAVDAVLFAPPFIINADEITKLVDIFVQSTEQVLQEKGISKAIN